MQSLSRVPDPQPVPRWQLFRALWVGVQGDLAVTMAGDDSPVTFANAIGIVPICVKRIEASTTASAIIALY